MSKPQGRGRGRLPEDLAGMKFGKLTVIATSTVKGRTNRAQHWLCRCDCGNEKVVSANNLKTSHSKSCGCSHRRTGSDAVNWRGHGDIGQVYWRCTKRSAARRGVEFSLSIEDAWSLFISQDGKCAMSGVAIGFRTRSRDCQTASLDRIDSSQPYSVGNVQWVHKDVNYMKMDLPRDAFLGWCRAIASNNPPC